jgi:hypothetical protein
MTRVPNDCVERRQRDKERSDLPREIFDTLARILPSKVGRHGGNLPCRMTPGAIKGARATSIARGRIMAG